MNIPSLTDIFSIAQKLPLAFSLATFFLTGSMLLLLRDWRFSILALEVQYLALGAQLAHLVRPEIAFAKILVGIFVGLMLYLSARQAGWRKELTLAAGGKRALGNFRAGDGGILPAGRFFRVIFTLFLMVAAVSLAQTHPIGSLPPSVSTAVYWLALVGIGLLILSENPIKVGQGLLTLLIGFELWYTTLEGSLLIVGLWGAVNLLLALAIGYLGIARGVNLEEDF